VDILTLVAPGAALVGLAFGAYKATKTKAAPAGDGAMAGDADVLPGFAARRSV